MIFNTEPSISNVCEQPLLFEPSNKIFRVSTFYFSHNTHELITIKCHYCLATVLH